MLLDFQLGTSNSTPIFVGQTDETTLISSIVEEKSHQVAGVVFLEMTEKILNYKIRDKHDWNRVEFYVRGKGWLHS